MMALCLHSMHTVISRWKTIQQSSFATSGQDHHGNKTRTSFFEIDYNVQSLYFVNIDKDLQNYRMKLLLWIVDEKARETFK